MKSSPPPPPPPGPTAPTVAAPAVAPDDPTAPSADASKGKVARSRSTRLKERVFPDVRTFDTKGAGFVPLPVVLRSMLWFFTTRQWMVLTAIYMRTSKEGVCWFDVGELSHDMGLGRNGKVTIRIRELEQAHFIIRRTHGGKEYYAAVDPRVAIQHLIKEKKIPVDRLVAINDLLESLKHGAVSAESDMDDLNAFIAGLSPKGKEE